jgi:hypothetical protein
MLFNIPSMADWCKIGNLRQSLTDRSNQHGNNQRIHYNYKVLVEKEGILCKAESKYGKEPWTIITSVHTNGTIRIQYGTKLERLYIPRVIPCIDK